MNYVSCSKGFYLCIVVYGEKKGCWAHCLVVFWVAVPQVATGKMWRSAILPIWCSVLKIHHVRDRHVEGAQGWWRLADVRLCCSSVPRTWSIDECGGGIPVEDSLFITSTTINVFFPPSTAEEVALAFVETPPFTVQLSWPGGRAARSHQEDSVLSASTPPSPTSSGLFNQI